MRIAFIVGFRDLDFAADPLKVTFAAIAGFRILGRLDWGVPILFFQIRIRHFPRFCSQLLRPDGFQNLHGWQILQFRWCASVGKPFEHPLAFFAKLGLILFPLLLTLPRSPKTVSIFFFPTGREDFFAPLSSCGDHRHHCQAQRFYNRFDAPEPPHFGEHGDALAAWLAMLLDQSHGPNLVHQLLKHAPLGLSLDQAVSKFTQDTQLKAFVIQRHV